MLAASSIVVVGANGSGKTRLGSWLDISSPQRALVHRTAAQKSLTIPDSTPTSSFDIAENSLLYGYARAGGNPDHKVGHKWQSKPNTVLQSDYDKLLTYLFTDEFDKSTKYRQQARDSSQWSDPPETRLDTIKRIWESVLLHRELIIHGGKLEARSKAGTGSVYHASEMSDGERVIFYLVGQVLAAKQGGIVVIDEPELHLHKSLQARLWDAVEAERPDCLFVYLTHDLDFAASRVDATKIWLKSYNDGQWDWHVIPSNQELPERLLLEILGSRKPVLFVEGDREGLDHFLFSHLYPGYTVIPVGGASAVIHATRSFQGLHHLHNLDCRGVIDRDLRDDSQVMNLAVLGVFCLSVSEIENMLLQEEVLREAAAALHREDTDELIAKAKAVVLGQMLADKDRLVSIITAARIEQEFSTFNAKALGPKALKQAVAAVCSGIDSDALYQGALAEIETIISEKNYSAALRVYNNKGLLPQVANLFGFKPTELQEYILRLVGAKENQRLLAALRSGIQELAAIEARVDAGSRPVNSPGHG